MPQIIRENIALVTSALLVFIAGTRVLAFVLFDVNTALTVLPVVDYIKILLSTLVSGISLLTPYIYLLVVMNGNLRQWLTAGGKNTSTHGEQWRTGLLFSPILLLGAVTMTALMAITFGTGLVILVLFIFYVRRKEKKQEGSGIKIAKRVSSNDQYPFANAMSLLIFGSLIFSPWASQEAISIDGIEAPIRAFLMGEQGDKTLLIMRDRSPHWIDTASIQERQVCSDKEKEWNQKRLVDLIPTEENHYRLSSEDLCKLASAESQHESEIMLIQNEYK